MERDPRAYLWDARRASALIGEFVAGRSWEDYEADPLLRSAVERQFEIVGEALNHLARVDSELAEGVPDLARSSRFATCSYTATPASMTAWCGRLPRRVPPAFSPCWTICSAAPSERHQRGRNRARGRN